MANGLRPFILLTVRGIVYGETHCPSPNTRESGHLAYKDAPFSVRAPVLLGTTICSIVKPGASESSPLPERPGFSLASACGPGSYGPGSFVLTIRLSTLVLEPVLVLLVIGHGGTFEGLRLR